MRLFMFALVINSLNPLMSAAEGDSGGGGSAEEKQAEQLQNIHKHFSANCFNECWNYIDKDERTPYEKERMLQLANASFYHWTQRKDVTKQNLSVGYWQLSRVYALAGETNLATFYGARCLAISKDGELAPFFMGYAYEALARTAQVEKNEKAFADWMMLAEEQLAKVTDEESKGYLKADLEALKVAAK